MSVVTRTRARTSGSTHVLLAACLWGTTGTVRTAVEAASNVSIAAVRVVLGGAVLLAIAAGSGRGEGLRRLLVGGRRGNRLALAAGAVAIAAYQTAFFSAAARTGVAVGTVVTIGSAPAFTGLLAVLTRRVPLTRRWLLATAGAVTGCAALVLSGGGGGGGTHGGAGPEPFGIALALLSGLAYAVYTTVVSALIGRGEDERAVTGALFGASALLMLPTLLTGAAAWTLDGRGAVVALYLGGVTTAGGYLLLARGLRTTPATTATTLTLAEPAVAAVLGVVVLHETLDGIALAGVGLLVASLILLLIPNAAEGPVVDGVTLQTRNC